MKKLLLIMAVLLLAVAVGVMMIGAKFAGYGSLRSTQITEKVSAPQVCLAGNCYAVEVAKTPEERSQGLMFRQNLDEDKGMFFIFPQDGIHSFWMKNTLIPLGVVWINADKKIVFISENTPPCQTEPCPPVHPNQNARYILEINAGQIKKIGARIADQVEFKKFNLR
jgi:uncharacterized membrane protein (UPF0127 family)